MWGWGTFPTAQSLWPLTSSWGLLLRWPGLNGHSKAAAALPRVGAEHTGQGCGKPLSSRARGQQLAAALTLRQGAADPAVPCPCNEPSCVLARAPPRRSYRTYHVQGGRLWREPRVP